MNSTAVIGSDRKKHFLQNHSPIIQILNQKRCITMAAGTYRSKTGELIEVTITPSGRYRLTYVATGKVTLV